MDATWPWWQIYIRKQCEPHVESIWCSYRNWSYSKEHWCHTYVGQEHLQDICELNLVGQEQSRRLVMLETLSLVVGETDRREGVEHRLPSDVFVLLEGIKRGSLCATCLSRLVWTLSPNKSGRCYKEEAIDVRSRPLTCKQRKYLYFCLYDIHS